ncbi:MAG: sulfurtransferase TusA family protein [Aminobacterium sp.]|nr:MULTISPECIES: sulfurtransferase TusA family protein [unclassified Aminobacterium]MDD2207245.1 sulfurtransferase TusA family protein [Aminobacterium sp.]MDD3426022.1 sulfurtransferase TusA family protein [Aminobacterium sp.]MDD3707237.1 sulfurtransferase TusA family protein [Aminobacterium sp.]MDD4229087.1 sulfurtransferase TusA family protein [Aminobacterium sp.]MDD4551921.1 sulfurtransferase TusA family protein [Aminobacterium sp.]
MSESVCVDARGLSCPQPVLETRKAIKDHPSGKIEILVDTVTSRENVSRFARSQKWNVTAEEFEGGYKVILTK